MRKISKAKRWSWARRKILGGLYMTQGLLKSFLEDVDYELSPNARQSINVITNEISRIVGDIRLTRTYKEYLRERRYNNE